MKAIFYFSETNHGDSIEVYVDTHTHLFLIIVSSSPCRRVSALVYIICASVHAARGSCGANLFRRN